MKVIAKKSHPLVFIIFSIIILIFVGVFVVLFEKGMINKTGFIAVCALCAFFASTVGIVFLGYKVNLCVDEEKISGKYGFFNKINCNISDVAFVDVQDNALILILNDAFKNKKYLIRGVENLDETGAFIAQRISFEPCEVTKSKIQSLSKDSKDRNSQLKMVIFLAALSLAWIIIAVILTGERELYEFSGRDWIIFSVMCVLLAATFIPFIVIVVRASKGGNSFATSSYVVRRSVFESAPLMMGLGEIKSVFIDLNATNRITVYNCAKDDKTLFFFSMGALNEAYEPVYICQSDDFGVDELNEIAKSHIDITDKLVNKK